MGVSLNAGAQQPWVFLLKNDHFGVFGGYDHRFRKPQFTGMATALPVEEIHGSAWRSVQNWTAEGAVWAFGVSEGSGLTRVCDKSCVLGSKLPLFSYTGNRG